MYKEELEQKLNLLINNIITCKRKIDETINNIQAIRDSSNRIKKKIELDVINSIDPVTGKTVFSNQSKRDNETDLRLKSSSAYIEKLQLINSQEVILKSLEYDLSKNKYLFRKEEILSRW